MRPIVREEILDFMTYIDRRDAMRPEILEAKRKRRISIGPYLMLLLENHQTVWYQIQEMMRVERIVREKDILHEIRTYNELIGKDGGVGACLLIGINDAEERAEKLTAWMDLLPTLWCGEVQSDNKGDWLMPIALPIAAFCDESHFAAR